jgi:type IV pilus assembly protein PilP
MKIKSKVINILFAIGICFFLFLFFGCEKKAKNDTEKKPVAEKVSKKISVPITTEKKDNNVKALPKKTKEVTQKIKTEDKELGKNANISKKIENNENKAEKKEALIETLLKEDGLEEKDKGEGIISAAIYDPKSRVNPFKALIRDTPKKKVKKEKKKRKISRPKTPLEKSDLGQLKLVAVISTGETDSAILEENTGKGYVVEVGTYVGLNSGQIIKTESDRIVIKETVEDITGKSIVKESILKIQKPLGE